MVQKIASNKLAGCPTEPTNRGGGGGGEKMPKKRRPNYMKPTKSSDARREKPQVSTIYSPTSTDKNSKSLNPSKSSSSSPLRPFKNKPTRATCSSTLKNSKFPKALELHPGGTEAQGTSAMRVCPYNHCSLNGDWHDTLPPLKSFISAKRKLLNTRKSFKLKGVPLFKLKASVKDEKEIVDDFFLKISAKVEEFEDLQLQSFGERNTQTELNHTNKYYYDMHMGDDLDEKTDLSIEEMDSMLSLLEYVEFDDAIEDQEEVKEGRESTGLPTLNVTSINLGEEEESIANHKSNLFHLPDDVLGPILLYSSEMETIGDVLSSEPFPTLCEMADADAEQFMELIKLEKKQNIEDEIPEDVILTDSTEEEDMGDEVIEELTINHDVHIQSDENKDRNWVSYSTNEHIQSDENKDRNWVSYSTNEHDEVSNVEGSIQIYTKQNSLEIDLVSEIADGNNYETDDVYFASGKGSSEDEAANTATTNTKQPLAEADDVTKARTRITRQKTSEEAEQMKEFNPRSPRFLDLFPSNRAPFRQISPMSAISAARAARFIFRPSAASAYRRHMSKAVPTRPTFFVDTLAIVRGMEARGIESEHAEAITAAITEVMNDGLESVGKSFVSQDQMQKSEKTWDADFSKFKSKVEISQEQHSFSLQRSSDKLEAKIDGLYWWIRDELMKQFSELKDQNTKHLDELMKQFSELKDQNTKHFSEFKDQNTKQISDFKDEYTKMTSKLDNDIQAMKSQLEVAKNEVIKYCIGALISISTVTVAVLRSWV